jgi:hypothetical protein
MIRMLAAAAMVAAAWPAHADVHKCQGPKGVTYSDGPCPSNSQSVTYTPRELLKNTPDPTQDLPPPRAGRDAPPPAPAPVTHAGRVTDAPAPEWDTGLPVIEQVPGRSAWLDADTIAVTTFSEPRAQVPWMVRRIVAADVRTRTAATIVPKGFLDCTNPALGLVGLQVGDLESRFAVRSTAPAAVQRFMLWDAARHAVGPATADYATGWHAASCLKPAPEDVASNEWWEGNRAVRYLQPKDGIVKWGIGESGRPEGPWLQNGGRRTMLDVSTTDLAKQVRYLPFRHAYQLVDGRYGGVAHLDTPLVLLTPEGKLVKTPLPASLRQALDAVNPVAVSFAVKNGLLVQVPGPAAQGGGLYLAQGDQAHRVWCTAGSPGAAECRIDQALEISPDGCKVAFDARSPAGGGVPTLRVLDLCAAPAAGVTARR